VNYSTLQIFGCPAYSLVDSQKRNKSEFKSKRCIFIGFTKEVKDFRLWDLETWNALPTEMWSLTKNQMLQEKSEDKAQGRAPDSSTESQAKKVEFSNDPKKPDGLDEDSDSDRDEHGATQQQPKLLRQSNRVSVSLTRYGWENDHVSFVLVIETRDPNSYR